jgi:RNA recognition motif-containing protein
MAKELYVGHISHSATEQDIRKLFSVVGTVTSVHLIIDPETREFKRCGYVRMAADVDPKEVIETLDGALLIDEVITVSIARPQKPGMSKSGKSGGPRKTSSGARWGAGPGTRSEQRRGDEPKGAAEPRPAARQRPGAESKPGAGTMSGQGPKSGRGQSPSSRSARDSGTGPGKRVGSGERGPGSGGEKKAPRRGR